MWTWYCGPVDGTGSYLKDFAGACTTCTTGPKDCKDVIENFVAKGKCHAACAAGWTDVAHGDIATQFKCTSAETKAMRSSIAETSGRTTPASGELSLGGVVQSSRLLTLISVVVVGVLFL